MELTDKHFIDWENETFGYGYGTGEEYIIPAVQQFFDLLEDGRSYHHTKLEQGLGPVVAWLIINRFCQVGIINYGTSTRGAWITAKGELLRDYLKGKTNEDLQQVLSFEDGYIHCYRDHCNCFGDPCNNPMFASK